MHPWLLEHPPVSMYGVCAVAAFVVAWVWGRRRVRAVGMEVSRFDLMMPVVLAAGLAGAWVAGWVTDFLTGGAAHSAVLVGALVMGMGAGIGYGVWVGAPLGVLGDVVAPPLALGIGVGRVGCFFAGCCFGRVCDVPTVLTGVRLPMGSFAAVAQGRGGESLAVYPVQLYESVLCAGLAVALWRWRARDERGVTGQKFLALGLGYAGLRFGLEFLRGDNPVMAGLTFSQWGAVAIFSAALTTWVVRWKHAERWNLARPENKFARQTEASA